MANHNDPSVIAQDSWTMAKLFLALDGLYMWEFFTTLDYEWSVIQKRRPYRWTIWLYSLTRVTTLIAVVMDLISLDVTHPINCQIFAYMAIATASLLIVLRVYSEARRLTTLSSIVNRRLFIMLLCTDIVLLLIMLVGLLRWHLGDGDDSPLARFLWIQGLVWFLIATVSYFLPVVFISLNINGKYIALVQRHILIELDSDQITSSIQPHDQLHDEPHGRNVQDGVESGIEK
ncbi:hypothetical protein F5148DRAFT_1336884 [Russula earlei]|uniref:Uncharacterized protein n=1 Tax=Russula earlei TaxID=71964 RepID=A0ACC0UH58_9AGAM|nr:hypothetical protein F5148DRAFT_1336884 [Russula earlei]